MARAFANITFTSAVTKFQQQMGSWAHYRRYQQGMLETVALTEREQQFIRDRDSFYQATVSENGWPYVQHRGGPIGFIKVLNETTLVYPDFHGNQQYLSAGNLTENNRISLIMMDYPHQRRLKLWGKARLVNDGDDDCFEQHDSQPSDRYVVIDIQAFDWNCPKHITPRYTQDNLKQFNHKID